MKRLSEGRERETGIDVGNAESVDFIDPLTSLIVDYTDPPSKYISSNQEALRDVQRPIILNLSE